MKLLKTFVLSIMLLTILSSCHKHDDIDVTIDIISPVANQVMANPAEVLFNIIFTASGELHDIEIKVYPKDNPQDLILDFDLHEHKKVYEFTETRDLSSYPAGTTFVLDVDAYRDEEGTKKETKKIEFKI
jgi:hypothetical protein